MRHRTTPSLLLFVAALTVNPLPAAAQEAQRPTGWEVIFDDAAAEDSSLFFATMEPGWHITSGPTSLLYDPTRSASGDFRLQAEVYLFPGDSDSGFGLAFGGSSLGSEHGQSYFQFLLRRDGSYMIAHRAGSELHIMTMWSAHEAVIAAEGAEEPVLNALQVIAGAEAIIFQVNDEEVGRYPRSPQMGVDGLVGLRVGDDLDLHVRSLTVAGLEAGD